VRITEQRIRSIVRKILAEAITEEGTKEVKDDLRDMEIYIERFETNTSRLQETLRDYRAQTKPARVDLASFLGYTTAQPHLELTKYIKETLPGISFYAVNQVINAGSTETQLEYLEDAGKRDAFKDSLKAIKDAVTPIPTISSLGREIKRLKAKHPSAEIQTFLDAFLDAHKELQRVRARGGQVLGVVENKEEPTPEAPKPKKKKSSGKGATDWESYVELTEPNFEHAAAMASLYQKLAGQPAKMADTMPGLTYLEDADPSYGGYKKWYMKVNKDSWWRNMGGVETKWMTPLDILGILNTVDELPNDIVPAEIEAEIGEEAEPEAELTGKEKRQARRKNIGKWMKKRMEKAKGRMSKRKKQRRAGMLPKGNVSFNAADLNDDGQLSDDEIEKWRSGES